MTGISQKLLKIISDSDKTPAQEGQIIKSDDFISWVDHDWAVGTGAPPAVQDSTAWPIFVLLQTICVCGWQEEEISAALALGL